MKRSDLNLAAPGLSLQERRRIFSLEFVSVRIENKCCVVVRTVVRPEARTPLINTAESQCSLVKAVH
jgi:hypothetical protein